MESHVQPAIDSTGTTLREQAFRIVMHKQFGAERAQNLSTLEVANDLLRCACTLFGGALHEPLETLGAMFTSEVAVPLAYSLIAAELRILADLPARITAEKIGRFPGSRQRGPAVPQ